MSAYNGCNYDFTSFEEDRTIVIAWCKKYAKKWCFQQEECPSSGNKHFQGRISLKLKKRVTEIKKDNLKFHFSVTSTINKDNDFYVTKEESRIDGPWSNEDEEAVETTQLKIFREFTLRPYQEWIKDEAQRFDMRAINLIYDKTGNMGKSIFAEYMESLKIIEEIPPYRLMDDIFQWVYCRPKRQAYFIDLPRGMKKDRLGDLYAGIEIIKNGVCYDKRNYAKKARFNRPRIFVFTNELPELSLMSKDRWVIHTINDDHELEVYDPDAATQPESEDDEN